MKRPDGTDWELGTGNFGKVLRGIRDDVQPVAVKSMFRRDRAMEEAFIREIAMMKCVQGLGPLTVCRPAARALKRGYLLRHSAESSV